MSPNRKRRLEDGSSAINGTPETVQSGPFTGFTATRDTDNGVIIELSSVSCRDVDRWTAPVSPELTVFCESLQVLDLSKQRYVTQLHHSIVACAQLQTLRLFGCSKLETLPTLMGQLSQLQEVRTRGGG